MAGLRPFRGLRYTETAGPLGPLLCSASGRLTPQEREDYAVRSTYNAIHIAGPDGHSDDRSKYIRFARAAAKLAEWRRGGAIAPETQPSFYRLTQRFGHSETGDPVVHTTLIALVDLAGDIASAEAVDPKVREERLRLLEATRTAFEASTAFYDDPDGTTLRAVREASASSEVVVDFDGVATLIETIDDPNAISAITAAFRDKKLLIADGGEGYEASRMFRQDLGDKPGPVPEDRALIALTSMDDRSFARIAVHRVVRRLPGGIDRQTLLAKLATLFTVEEHHSRNLFVHLDRLEKAGEPAFGLCIEGGVGYLLTPQAEIELPASIWFQQEVLAGLLGMGAQDSALYFTDPLQAARAADEGAAAAFIFPRPTQTDLQEAVRQGLTLPYRSAMTYPSIPTGLVMWSMGDEA